MRVARSRWFHIFVAVHVLVLSQVVWWTSVFMKDVGVIAKLKLDLGGVNPAFSVAEVEREAFHRRFMFLSESVFFALTTMVGMYLLLRALRSEERSRQIERNFIEMVSHESKTPLTALKLRLESIAENTVPENPPVREIGLALEEVRRLSSLFEKVLNLNRVERQAFRFETLHLADVVKEVVCRLEPLFRARGIHINLALDSEALVNGDPQGLQNSIQSLIENAVLYNQKSEKQLNVTIRRNQSKVILAIEDNGPGISVEDRTKIFERFYRGVTSHRVAGTGLGLFIAKTIIEAHQGAIHLVSRVAEGCHFEIELPEVTHA